MIIISLAKHVVVRAEFALDLFMVPCPKQEQLATTCSNDCGKHNICIQPLRECAVRVCVRVRIHAKQRIELAKTLRHLQLPPLVTCESNLNKALYHAEAAAGSSWRQSLKNPTGD